MPRRTRLDRRPRSRTWRASCTPSCRRSRKPLLCRTRRPKVGACGYCVQSPGEQGSALAERPTDAGVDRGIRGKDGGSDHAPAWAVLDKSQRLRSGERPRLGQCALGICDSREHPRLPCPARYRQQVAILNRQHSHCVVVLLRQAKGNERWLRWSRRPRAERPRDGRRRQPTLSFRNSPRVIRSSAPPSRGYSAYSGLG